MKVMSTDCGRSLAAAPIILALSLGACDSDTPSVTAHEAGVGAEQGDAGVMEDGDVEPEEDAAGEAFDASGDASNPQPERMVLRPEQREPTEARIAALSVPEGFHVGVFARDLGHARMLASHGPHIYLTRPRSGDVLRLNDADSDGVAESSTVVASGLMGVHGIAFGTEHVFLATPTAVYRATVVADGSFGAPGAIITDLPDGGQHPNRTLGIGPDNKLYISVGSSCDACMESNPEHATLLRSELDGSARTIFASGLRNTLGFAWHPDSRELWGMDQGADWRGNDLPPEELNRIEQGKDYGWPYCFAERQADPVIMDPPEMSKQAYCEATEAPVLTEQAHGSPLGLVFYRGTQFPELYRSSAFVPMRGSWNRLPATGYKLLRVTFEDGEPTAFEDFLTGFLIEDGAAEFGRPTGLTIAADGALLFTDDERGIIYRVSYSAP
jgi:glucose/arabinose dehydrogenase